MSRLRNKLNRETTGGRAEVSEWVYSANLLLLMKGFQWLAIPGIIEPMGIDPTYPIQPHCKTVEIPLPDLCLIAYGT